jgi:sensor histidine kinase regulating citrate/malate metabolism
LSVGAFVCSGILAVANIAVLYLIHIMEKRITEEKELMLLNQQMDIQAKSISALEKSYRAQRVATHEFQHHLQTIHDLLDQKELETLTGYVNQLQGIQTTRLLSVNTKHPIIDAVLNQKHQAAKESDIEIDFHITDLSNISIDTTALVVLLSNLLDNAIEACRALPQSQRFIELILRTHQDILYYKLANSYDGTTKRPNDAMRGHGLENVRRCVEQYGGQLLTQQDQGFFIVSAHMNQLPNSET